MEKTPKNDAGKKASELIIKCDKLVEPVTNCDQSNEVIANCDFKKLIYDELYLLGASVKDMGVGLCAITKMQTTPETVLGLLE